MVVFVISRTLYCVVCLLVCHVLGSRILILPNDHVPHVDYFSLVGQSLMRSGHDVYIIAMERHMAMTDQYGIPNLVPKGMKHTNLYPEPGRHENQVFKQKISQVKIYQEIVQVANGQCGEILENDTLMESYEKLQFDLAIVDAFDINKCLYIIPYRLGVPYVTLTFWPDPWTAMVPALPSVESRLHIGTNLMSDSIIGRLYCAGSYIYFHLFNPLVPDDSMIDRYAPNRPQTTFQSLVKNSEMFLIQQDNRCLEGPHVSAPHYVFVGGVGHKKPQPVQPMYENFIKDADHGVIILCFSSKMKILPIDFLEKLMGAFRQVKQKVIIRHVGPTPDNLPTNVMFADWLPLTDLLGHPKTRLFITHGGHNSQLESLYHVVPMLFIPFYLDQTYNTARAVTRGYGLQLDWETFTSEELLNAIKELLDNPKYVKNIKRCSDILKDFPAPQEQARFWIEHVLKFGSSHLRPKHMDMPLWKFFMLDVFAVVTVTVFVFLFVISAVCLRLMRKCTTDSGKKKTE